MRRPVAQGSVALALTALLAATGAAPATATGPEGEARLTSPSPSKSAVAAHTVRLITGDSVVVTGTGDQRIVTFAPDADSPGGVAEIQQYGTDITVIPEEVRPLLEAGTLDARLFDIDGLIAQGYADGADLPLIVRRSKASAPLPAGAEPVRKVAALDATAAVVEAPRTGAFWKELRSAAKGASAKRLSGGVEKVWLDGRVRATLAESVPQIGAPDAWAKGFDGKGVRVAVLDTGVDSTHPDLVGRVSEARNFTETADAVDHHGHGTHVASTVGGTGAASGGRNKGVAPGADLMVGKVLNDAGQGSDSSVLGGMEWAAHSGAKVISMSLGADAATDGTDPLSTAVNELTAETGALFVIAAGNTGPGPTTIGSPGSADSALTVAAVDKQDKIASFSSRGPRLRDSALKPDIAAPGVNIVAARAAGTAMGTPADAHYTAASGTSMATPHVAGAAAILAGAHPDWTAAEIKGALMSAADVVGAGAFAEGSGRTDVPAALEQTVWATNASFGTVAPRDKAEPVTRKVTFHNTADRPVTLALTGALTLDATGAVADGALTLGADSVTVPAGGSSEVAVTVAPDLATAYGTYTGTVTATGGEVSAHATVALNRQQPTVKLNFKGVMPDGTAPAAGTSVTLYDLGSDRAPTPIRIGAGGLASAQVQPGRYAIVGHLQQGQEYVSFGIPDIDVKDQDVSVTADGRKAVPIKAKTPERSELRNLILSVGRQSTQQKFGVTSTIVLGRAGGHQWAIPAAKPQDGTFGLTTNRILQSPPIVARAKLPSGTLDLAAESFLSSGRFDGTRSYATVDVGHGSAAELAEHPVEGKLALFREGGEDIYTVLPRLVAAGAAAVMVVNEVDDRQVGAFPAAVPVFGVPKSSGDRVAAALAERPVTIKLTVESHPAYVYGLVRGTADGIAADQTYVPKASELAGIKLKNYSPAADPAALKGSQEGWLGYSETTGRGSGGFGALTFGTTQRVYVNAKDARWQRVAVPLGNGPAMLAPLKPYTAGTTVTEEWFKPVMRAATPSTATSPATGMPASRNDEGMLVQIPVWASASAGSWEGVSVRPGDTNEFRAYRDGQLLGTSPVAYARITGLPSAKSSYRFELDAKRTEAWWGVSTEARTAWTFDSEQPAGVAWETLPLLNADYDLDGVALDSSVEATRTHRLKVTFRNPGTHSRLTGAKIDVSYDGGTTWTTLRSQVTDRTSTVGIKPPRNAKTMSLRVRATNAAGSTLDQTVLNAARVVN
ncbi:S8 family serine peptidase [Streptomyces sp. NPDC091271]|uniref:S8 family serine peptidase n=1 Tax=Streptomyces sp. NPDC091271 TaxID=3365980 RepID=UPI003815FF33